MITHITAPWPIVHIIGLGLVVSNTFYIAIGSNQESRQEGM